MCICALFFAFFFFFFFFCWQEAMATFKTTITTTRPTKNKAKRAKTNKNVRKHLQFEQKSQRTFQASILSIYMRNSFCGAKKAANCFSFCAQFKDF